MKRVIRATTQLPVFSNTTMNPRKGEYYQYLTQHIGGVIDTWHTMLKPAMSEAGYDPELLEDVDRLVEHHDESKYQDDEFTAYCNYFYSVPDQGYHKSEKDFDAAWLLHQHRNPHHHQYWILVRDTGEIVPQDMPDKYICEMLCDWHSFSRKDPESTAYAWYQKNKSKMKFSDKTRKTVEKLVEYLQDPLV